MREQYATSEVTMTDQAVPFDTDIISFGPTRIMGISIITSNQNGEVPALWHQDGGFAARMHEVQQPAEGAPCYGVCRCAPGITDGRFEYIAAASASAEAMLPEGMVELTIPEAIYLVITVPGLAQIHAGWEYVGQWFEANPEWKGFCDSDQCECIAYPSFEYYTSEFFVTNKLYVYVPIRKKG